MAYKSPPGYHRHRCKFCGFVWEHADYNDISHGSSGAHECPACHRCNWSLGIYTGDESPRARHDKEPDGPDETDLECVASGKDTVTRANVALDEMALTSRALREKGGEVLDKTGRLLDSVNRLFG